MFVPVRGWGSKALVDMLMVKEEGSRSAFNDHAETPHGVNAASRKEGSWLNLINLIYLHVKE